MATKTLNLSGYSFQVREGKQGEPIYNPAGAVQVSAGRIRLFLTKVDGFFQSSAVMLPRLGYGFYDLYVTGRLDGMDPSAVFAFWLHDEATLNEIDIVEATRWSDGNNPNLYYTSVWHGPTEQTLQEQHAEVGRGIFNYRFVLDYRPDACDIAGYGLQGERWVPLFSYRLPSMEYGSPRIALWCPSHGILYYNKNEARGAYSVLLEKFSFTPHTP